MLLIISGYQWGSCWRLLPILHLHDWRRMEVFLINNSVNNNIHLGRRPPKFSGPRLKPMEHIAKSGTG
jgi:hypothetical protein